jgi:hypothetical protein
MKKKLFVVLGVLLALGLFFTACSSDESSSDDLFTGTWEADAGNKVVAANRSWTQYVRGVEGIRGTYTLSGNVVNAKTTEANPVAFGGTGSWMKYSDLPSNTGIPENITATINGNTCVWMGVTLTKQ